MEYCQPSLAHAGNSTKTTIPLDLSIEILSLLPAKSLIRFQSVSKLWFSTIRSKTFVDLFLTRSKTRPRLLLTFHHLSTKRCFIFSAPQHDHKDDDKSISSFMARYDMTILTPVYNGLCSSINGFVVCFRGDVPSFTVYNPTTRQIVKLPNITTCNGILRHARLGYDPVEDQYKVLCVIFYTLNEKDIQPEHLVCTVSSSQRQEWRKIKNPTGDNYECVYGDTCIDGALYYGVGESRIVRFDVRSEMIEFIKTPKESHIDTPCQSTLINYKGKLGYVYYCRSKKLMRLWVLEDAEKPGWSSTTLALPSQWEDLIWAHFVSEGMILTGELMVYDSWLESYKPFYVYYYDFDKKSTRKVEVQGMEYGDFTRIHDIGRQVLCYPGHIDNIRFL